ncbi:MAG: hypothetical protein ABR507_09825 [Actinomycetota bacterium]|nr:hypothetical protein [Actinomycetota bacterium]
MRNKRWLSSVVLVVPFLFTSMPIAHAETAASVHNIVTVINQGQDGQLRGRSATSIATTSGTTSSPANLARATGADCTGCWTTAVAIQAIYIVGDPSVVAPNNAAVAINSNCTSCMTAAFAYQHYVASSGRIEFTGEEKGQIDEIARGAQALATSGSSPFDIASQLDPMVQRLWSIIDGAASRSGPGNHWSFADKDERSS